MQINVGETIQLNVVSAIPATADKSVTWSAEPTNIASIDENGLLTGRSKGTVYVTATSKSNPDVSAHCFIDVLQEEIVPTSIELNKSEHQMTVGETFELKVSSVQPSDAVETVVWESSDNSVASVNSDGLVTALKAGTVTITVKSVVDPNVKATCVINITAQSGNSSDNNGKPNIFGCAGEIMTAAIFIPIILGMTTILLIVLRKKGKKDE